MILGNNNFSKENFQNKMNAIKNNASNMNSNKSINTNSISTNQYKDVTNQDEMISRSLEMLQERLNKGLISYEEFQKQCTKLGKLRK